MHTSLVVGPGRGTCSGYPARDDGATLFGSSGRSTEDIRLSTGWRWTPSHLLNRSFSAHFERQDWSFFASASVRRVSHIPAFRAGLTSAVALRGISKHSIVLMWLLSLKGKNIETNIEHGRSRMRICRVLKVVLLVALGIGPNAFEFDECGYFCFEGPVLPHQLLWYQYLRIPRRVDKD